MDIDEDRTKIRGKVFLYTDRTSNEPMMSMRQDVTPDLPTILGELSGRYSPIQSKLSVFFLCYIIDPSLESNSRIYVREDDLWSGKGRFQNALTDRDPVDWIMDGKGEMSISLLIVRIILFDMIFVLIPFW